MRCTVRDHLFKKYVAREHMAQMLQHVIILGLPYSVDVVASETGVARLWSCRLMGIRKGRANTSVCRF